MKVRLKEFAPHIIAMIVVFIFMVASSFLYTNFVSETIRESIYDQVSTYARAEVVNITSAINEIKTEQNNLHRYTVVTIANEPTLNEYNYCFLTEKEAEGTESETLYAYIKSEEGETDYIKIDVSTIMGHFSVRSSTKAFGIVDKTGAVYYGFNISTDMSLYKSLVDSNTSVDVKDKIKSAMYNDGTNTGIEDLDSEISQVVKLDGHIYYFGASRISQSFYYFSFFDLSEFESIVAKTNQLNLVYRLTLAISFTLIFIDLALIVLRSNRLLTIRSSKAAKHGTAIIKINKKGRVKFYARGRNTFGMEVNDFNIFNPVDGKTFEAALKSENRFICEYENQLGEKNYAEFVVVPHQGGYIVISNIVTEEFRKELELRKLTEHNQISNLPNRNALFKDIEKLKATFFKKQVTLAKIKLVEFESVSKTLGFNSGDKLLLESINLIQDRLEEDDFLYQDENDSLILILAGTYHKNDEKIARLLTLFNKPIHLIKSTIFVHLKIGSVELKNVLNKDFDLKESLEKVAIALNRANEQVSVPIVKYDSNLETYVNYRNQMEKDMHEAIETGEFVMYYQPQYNILDRRIEGFESLIRWDNPKYKDVSPQVYIELAEKNGDIVEIGRFINRSVFKAAKVFEEYGVHLSINVSPAQLIQSGFIDELLTEFKNNQLKKGSICVEITETYVMENYTLMIEKLNILRNAGFSIHLDDFGTGYSSMLYLKELPIDTIKTDMEFIRNLESDEVSQVIESQVIQIAKSLDLKVICEGVERASQVSLLQKYGADYLQGYLVSKAVPMEEAINMVRNGVIIPGLKEGSR